MLQKISHFFESDKGKRVKNMIIGLGASVVLMGALFKIQHWPGAGPMLIIGMSVEAVIFALQGILPPHADYYWEKLYPNLNISPEHDVDFIEHEAKEARGSVTEQLDEMLEKSQVEPQIIERLGQNLNKLGDNISKMSDMTDASAATNEYSEKAREAANTLAEMKVAYTEATAAISQLSGSSSDASEYRNQIQMVNKNLASLNSIYEMELQDTNNHLKVLNQMYGTLSKAVENVQESVDDTARFRQEMAVMAKNLESLNNVYGNMLAAMKA